MTTMQRFLIGLGLVSFVVLGLFPPWVETVNIPYRMHFEKPAGYSFIMTPPRSRLDNANLARMASMTLDISRLGVEWAITVVVTLGLLLIIRLRDRADKAKPTNVAQGPPRKT